MKLKIEINMDNAAFEDDAYSEVESILRNGWPEGPFVGLHDSGQPSIVKLRDSNGNTVGFAEVSD